jgi:hypothetical protein
MNSAPAKISEALEQKAKVFATVAEDIVEESLTGESSEKERNEAEAKLWQHKSEALLQAAANVAASAADQPTPIKK